MSGRSRWRAAARGTAGAPPAYVPGAAARPYGARGLSVWRRRVRRGAARVWGGSLPPGKLGGVVKRWNEANGFGFAKPDDSTEDLVHRTSTRGDALPDGARVAYVKGFDAAENKAKADKVSIVGGGAPAPYAYGAASSYGFGAAARTAAGPTARAPTARRTARMERRHRRSTERAAGSYGVRRAGRERRAAAGPSQGPPPPAG